jgi:lipopolysaccharide transport system ATP-binding protein
MPAISILNIGKCYHIYDKPGHRLLQGLWRGTKQFNRKFWALRDVSFAIGSGETVGIIGRNGSGKSTLLQIISGTLTPTHGQVEINGRVAALLELGAGFNPEFTGRENVYMNAAILGLSRKQIDDRYEDIIAFADIGEFIEQPIKTYSSGMYVRLAFAVIAHVDADILIIDEALAVGDALFTQKCMRFLRNFQKKGTVLFVSHDTASVLSLCRRAIWLEAGQIQMMGDAKEVCEAYMEFIYGQQQGPSAIAKSKTESKNIGTNADSHKSIGSHIIEQSFFSQDQPSFGKGGARIINVRLLDIHDDPLSVIRGGETVIVSVQAKIEHNLQHPLIGFFVKDRLGQSLFGDIALFSEDESDKTLQPGKILEARFEFAMPLLPVGDFSICAAIAEGSFHHHVQHHWIHDALIFRVNASDLRFGLVGLPMHSTLNEVDA